MRLPSVLLCLLIPPLLGGCVALSSASNSVSTALGSISGSLGSISDSLSSDGNTSAMYRRDVKLYAAGFVARGGSRQDFLRGLSRVAESHGVVQWETHPATMRSVGAGLAAAKVPSDDVQRLCDSLAGNDPARARLVWEGYRGIRS